MRKSPAAIVFVLLIAAGLALAAWPQMFGLERTIVVAQVVALRVGVLGVALGVLTASLLLALWPPIRRAALTVAAMLAVFALVTGGIHLSRGTGTSLSPEPGDITVLAWNTLGNTPGEQALIELIVETGADIVALPETTGPFADSVAASLHRDGAEFQVFSSGDGAWGARHTSLLISARLGGYTADPTLGVTMVLPTVAARPDDGAGPVIIATHPIAPGPRQVPLWRAELDMIARLCNDLDSAIIAGDFNSTLDHWASLGTADGDLGRCADAARQAGAGTTGTWPSDLPSWLGAQIDHVVATEDWQVVDTYVVTDRDHLGSDHRPVVAILRPRP